jgi:hypothetical protein
MFSDDGPIRLKTYRNWCVVILLLFLKKCVHSLFELYQLNYNAQNGECENI